jgi:2-C-methyl-D-erythritol 4-phosphate cytidylyltransferase
MSAMTIAGVIVAAGASTRMDGVNKLLQPLHGRPLLAYSLAVFAGHPRVERVVVVASPANFEPFRALAAEFAGVGVVLGGARRRDSVLCGLQAAGDCDIIVVHDGARPLVTEAMIDAVIDGAIATGAALCAVPVADTVKRGDAKGLVEATVVRDGLWLAQTPQAFRADLLRRAHAATDADATDDAALVEGLAEPVRLVAGSRENLKVTTPEDLALAEALLAARGYTAS